MTCTCDGMVHCMHRVINAIIISGNLMTWLKKILRNIINAIRFWMFKPLVHIEFSSKCYEIYSIYSVWHRGATHEISKQSEHFYWYSIILHWINT